MNEYYFAAGGILLIDGESGKPVLSAENGQAVDLSGYGRRRQDALFDGLKKMIPAAETIVSAFDEIEGCYRPNYRLQVIDAAGNGASLTTGESGFASIYLPLGHYTLKSVEAPGLPGVEMDVYDLEDSYNYTIDIPDDREPEDEGAPEA